MAVLVGATRWHQLWCSGHCPRGVLAALLLLLCVLSYHGYKTALGTNRPVQLINHLVQSPEVERHLTTSNSFKNGNRTVVHIDRLPVISPYQVVPLPTCPSDLKLNFDNRVLETLLHCVNHSTLSLPPQLETWSYRTHIFCDGKAAVYDYETVLLYDVIMDKHFCNNCTCGQHRHDPTSSPMDNNFPNLRRGFFRLKCSDTEEFRRVYIRDADGNHINVLKGAVDPVTLDHSAVDKIYAGFTIVVSRYEFWNLYHSMSDILNAFLAMKYFNITVADTDIVFIDGHPPVGLTPLWTAIFRTVKHVCEVPALSYHKHMLWNKLGYNSELLDYTGQPVPYIEEFSQLVLGSFDLTTDGKQLDCTQVNVLFISRVDYSDRTIGRKMVNEADIVKSLTDSYPTLRVHRVVLEQLEIGEQLRLISQTDILLGMHGAGLTHALFLPAHAGIIELIPDYFTLHNGHFKGITRWRHLKYLRWTSRADMDNTTNMTTVVPLPVVLDLMAQMMKLLC